LNTRGQPGSPDEDAAACAIAADDPKMKREAEISQ
jgi:hypothetical protein